MLWRNLIVILSVVTAGLSINRPVYKIVLTQKGYAQFLQYDIETPPLREFTFCTWLRIYDLSGDQSIFTYVANGNNRVVRLWLDSGGRHINVSINGKVGSSTIVDLAKDVWRHVCLSYQSDYGAWALYLDNRLVYCQASQSLAGFVLPGSGSVIVGYGTDVNGAQNGLEGEIFGANMILMSTIERNYTIKNDPKYEQKPFHRNRMKGGEPNVNYVILSDLQTDEVNNNFETTRIPLINSTKSYIIFNTPFSFIEHEVGKSSTTTSNYDKDFFGNSITEKAKTEGTSNTWNLNTNAHSGKYKISNRNKNELHGSEIKNGPAIPDFEVPPPPRPTFNYIDKSLEGQKPPVSESIYKVNEDTTDRSKSLFGKKYTEEISEVETPPPVDMKTKVYGQWTSSKFAGNVLNYLKNLQSHKREQKKVVVPQTIPLVKMSDNFPYASDFKVIKVRPPYHFQRKNIVEKQQFENKRTPQINVQILEDDLRSNIIKSHAQTLPKNVEISSRGITKKRQEHRFYRNVDNQEESQESTERTENVFRPKPLDLPKTRKISQTADLSLQNHNLMTILPFLKSLEYFIEDSQTTEMQETEKNSDIYTRSLSLGNKWHNVKSYSNDYTPREIKIGYNNDQANLEEKIAQANKRHPSVRLKYKHDDRKIVAYNDDESLLKARALAMEVSNQSNSNIDSVSILKYNHGYLPGKKIRLDNKVEETRKSNVKKSDKSSFNQHVKLGNALNERPVIGESVEQNKRSFIGGDERIPDINKYRADTESDNIYDRSIPGSLGPRICKNLELYDRVLYVQPDESIDMTHILSPVRVKNIGIEFIMQNYKKCSLEESNLQFNSMLFIDWSKTPVRLFGGAYPRKTTDLCGFF